MITKQSHSNDILDVLISPTTRCNLRCKYCYVQQNTCYESSDMTLSDIQAAYTWLAMYALSVQVDCIRFTWFGGEPLFRGISFLREAISLQERLFSKKVKIINTIQSNLTLVSNDLITLLKEHFQGSIGGSIDYNSCLRMFPNGRNSLLTAEDNVRRLQRAGISVGLVCTLTKQNTTDPRALYEYYKRLGTSFRVNRAAGVSACGDEYLSVTEYSHIVKQIFDVYLSDPSPTIEFTNFTMMVRLYLAGMPVICVDPLKPHLFLGIEAQGRIMSRCRFTGQIGNYFFDTSKTIYDKCNAMLSLNSLSPKCVSCEFFSKVCLGGCLGEPDTDCFCSNCGYRTETTYDLWCYVRDYLERHGHKYAELNQ